MLITPIMGLAAGTYFSINTDELKTEGPALQRLTRSDEVNFSDVAYIGDIKFSARFYSVERSRNMSRNVFKEMLADREKSLPKVLGVPRNDTSLIAKLADRSDPIDENLRYVFFAGDEVRAQD
jgi:hypothetical protein